MTIKPFSAYINTLSEVQRLVDCIYQSEQKMFSYDFETLGNKPSRLKVAGLGLAFGYKPGQGSYIVTEHEGIRTLPWETVLEVVKPLFEDPTFTAVAHNQLFDATILDRFGVNLHTNTYDTMVLNWLLNTETSNALDDIVERRYGHKMDTLKGVGYIEVDWHPGKILAVHKADIAWLSRYAVDDVLWTYRLALDEIAAVKADSRLDKVYHKLYRRYLRVLTHMEAEGIYIDSNLLNKMASEVKTNLASLEFSLQSLRRGKDFDPTEMTAVNSLRDDATRVEREAAINADRKKITALNEKWKDRNNLREVLYEYPRLAHKLWNLNSNAHLNRILFEELKLKPSGEKTAFGLYTVDSKALLKYQNDDKTGYVKNFLKYRKLHKLHSVYLDGLKPLIDADGRLRTSFNPALKTGRLSSRAPNLQNIIHDDDYPVRSLFIAPPGNKLVVLDYCIAEGTRVATKRGMVPVEAVTDKDLVQQEDGSFERVLSVIDKGVLPVKKVFTKQGYVLTATEQHRIRVLDENGDYVWRRIAEIRSSDRVAIQLSRGVGQDREILPELSSNHHNEKSVTTPTHVNPALSFFMGYLTGGGSFKSRSLSWVVCDKDPEVFDLLNTAAEKLFGREVTGKCCYRGVYQANFHSKTLSTWMSLVGGSKEHVPEYLWRSDREIIASYLAGLFEAAGSVGDRISFSTVSEELSVQVQQLLALLGIAAKREKINHGKGCGWVWLITIPKNFANIFQENIGFVSVRKSSSLERLVSSGNGSVVIGNMPNLHGKIKNLPPKERVLLKNTFARGSDVSSLVAARVRDTNPSLYRELGLFRILEYNQIFDEVVSVEDSGLQPVYDLEVENTHSYVSEGFISHNSQMELRILAHYSGDEKLIDGFKKGFDPHSITAKTVFNLDCDVAEVATKHKQERKVAKMINFSVVYGVGPASLAEQIADQTDGAFTPTPEQAQGYMDTLFQQMPGIRQYIQESQSQARKHGVVYTLIGRPRHLPDAQQTEDKRRYYGAMRRASNTKIQGSAADIIAIAMCNIADKFEKYWRKELKMCLQVHDELIFETDEEMAEEFLPLLKHEMENAVKLRVPLAADGKIVDSWAAAK